MPYLHASVFTVFGGNGISLDASPFFWRISHTFFFFNVKRQCFINHLESIFERRIDTYRVVPDPVKGMLIVFSFIGCF